MDAIGKKARKSINHFSKARVKSRRNSDCRRRRNSCSVSLCLRIGPFPINHFRKSRKSRKARNCTKGNQSFLPDEIITNILSWLPAKSAMRCRLVCKGWKDLTFDPDFVELHLGNSIPTILVADHKDHFYGLLELSVIDKWWEIARTELMIQRLPSLSAKFFATDHAIYSLAGLLVLCKFTDSESSFTILNVASHEHVRITVPSKYWLCHIYGVYYHPSLKEYCCLLNMKASRSMQMQYKILNLGFNPSLKTIDNLFSNRILKDYGNPVLINSYIYWLLRDEEDFYGVHCDIMEFDIIREEFKVLPCPVPLNIKCSKFQTHLLNVDGILCFLLALPTKTTIWRLESDKLWKSDEYALSIDNFPEIPGVIAIEDGMLALLDRTEERLLVCNLMEGTVKNYPIEKYRLYQSFLSHHISLASLKNCKPLISIDKDGEVVI